MRSVFTKKPKMKLNSKSKVELNAKENESVLPSEEKTLLEEQNEELRDKYSFKRKDEKKKPRSGSMTSSSSEVYIRRGLGVSVTFESTLPTQIWQASPSPSPPLSEKMKNDTKGVYKNCASGSSNQKWNSEGSNTRIRMSKQSFHGSLNNIDELDDSSDETNPSGLSYPSLSSCTSSDETTTSQERLNHPLGSSTSDSSSSLDLHVIQNNGPHSKRRSSERHHKNKKDKEDERYKSRRAVNEKRRQYTTQSLSSSSTSSEEDLEAFGWDEKTISALTNRSKCNKQCSIFPSNGKFDLRSKNVNDCLASPKRLPQGQRMDLRWKPDAGLAKLKLSSPVRICNQFHVDTPVIHPQTCILSRRLNPLIQSSSPNAANIKSHPIVPNSSYAHNSLNNNELLAVVNTDFRPSAEWKERYKLLSVRQGEYVCVLNHNLQSSTNNGAVDDKTKYTGIQQKVMFPLTENNFWFYVRRWCVDHLVATGTPGYIPRQTCRVLSNCEISSLRCSSQKARTPWDRASNAHFVSMTDPQISESSSSKNGVMQANNEFRPPQPTTNKELTNRNPHTNATCPNQVGMVFSTQIDRRNPVYSLQNFTPDTSANFLPPPPPGFGSGASIGSETEDKDSGRGPSSGSEWGSGRGGSSNITLDRSVVEHTSSEIGLDFQGSQQNRRSRNVKSAEESQLGWYAPTGLAWSERGFHEGEESLSRDSAFQSPNTDNLTPPVHMKDVNQNLPTQQTYPPSAITLTTITGNTPVLEMRHNGTPTLCARGVPLAISTNGPDSLATSTTTCATVVDIREIQDDNLNNMKTGPSTKYRVPTPDPSCWEPYKTVIHVNETSLEKFTLV
uniref:Uncharacterized protein n=1 Tax=Trichobilharzia regenti TaxID=157069 RepID=A0AA85JWR5_TRIRE|nr:unnamed protein product [Trichobilharzia regenti]